jgi:hypothetical protein
MECDYIHLNHNLLVSPKKWAIKGMIIKGVYCKTFLGLALKCMIIILFFKISFHKKKIVKNSANYYLKFKIRNNDVKTCLYMCIFIFVIHIKFIS